MPSFLGLYIEDNLIKYAKVSKDKENIKIDSFGIKFYNNVNQAIKQIIEETYSYKTPISINLTEESYQYFSMFSLLNKKDLEKAIKLEFEAYCSEKGYNLNSLDTRYVIVNNTDSNEKIKVIHISNNKMELNKIKQNTDDEEFKRKYKTLMKVPVYVDSPLAISATEIFKQNMDLFEDEIQEEIENGDNPLEFKGLKFTQTAEESKALNESQEPAIIISASGMCDVGRIKHHLKHNIWNPKSTILFVGYQAPGTLGYSIVNGAKKVTIFGEEFAVNARIEYIEGYSGHADQEWLMNFIYSFITKPKHIFLVHGEPESTEVLRNKILEETGIGVAIPEFGETYELSEELKIVNKIITKKSNTIRQEILSRLNKLQNEMQDMQTFVKEDVDDIHLRDEDMFRINEKIKDLEKQILNIIEG